MRRYRVRLLIGVTLLLALSGIILEEQGMWSASAQPANTSCTGALTGTFANVVVPASASCTLTNALVQGNVQVQSNARLVVGGASTIRGNVAANQCVSVMLSGTVTVSGNVAIQRCTQPSGYTGPGIQISGNVACQDNAGACVAQSGTVSGNMQIQNNRSAAATDISRNSIRGNLQCQGNTPAPTHVLGPNAVAGNAAGQCSASLGFITTNRAPVANAGTDQTVAVGTTVHLDGSQSYALGGTALRLRWAFKTTPTGSLATLSDPTAVKPTFVADRPGTYTVQLIVNDGTRDSAPDTVLITTQQNTPPVAYAGPDQTVVVGQTVTLDGSGSTDVDGDPLQYQWLLVTRPTGSQAPLANPTLVHPTLAIDRRGTYTVQLIVSDGKVTSAPDTVTLTTTNTLPVAHAGPDQTVGVGTTVTLDGSGSTDVDGDALLFTWSFAQVPGGSAATLSDPTIVNPTFVMDKAGTYMVQLLVNDGFGQSAPDTVTITTQNSRPVAKAGGVPQTAAVGTTVTLDGSASSDVDGNALTFLWALTTVPTGSAATLVNPTGVHPTFVVDKAGTYVAQLIVNDGTLDSAPVTVTITTQNSRPVANAGGPQTAAVGTTVTLDGSASSDVDGNALTFLWVLTTAPAGSAAILADFTGVHPTFVVDKAGTYVAQLTVNDGTLDSLPATVTISTLNSRPVANAGAPQTVVVGATVTLDGSASSDADGDPLTFLWALTTVPTGSTATLAAPTTMRPTFGVDTPGTYIAQLIVNDGTLDSTPVTVTITATSPPPPPLNAGQITVSGITNGLVTVTGTPGAAIAGTTVTVTNTRTGQKVTGTVQAGGSFTLQIAAQVGDTLSFVVTDTTGQSSPATTVTVGSGLPPDPSTVASTLDPGVVSTLGAATSFLYSGAQPIQTGVAPGTIEAKRAGVLRGRVFDRTNATLPGVTISILNHPEFGQTLSRADGMFDLAVNGGGLLTVSYQKAGFLPAQRQVNVPWQDYAVVADVALVSLDTQVTTINLNAGGMQFARGSAMADADGSRRATLLVPAGTTAQIFLANGTTQPVSSLNVRFTEYTVGANGPKTMPAQLPPTSGYTYAVEIHADESIAKIAGKDVSLNQPVFFYLENFLNFPVGGIVPVGYYDNDTAAWIPSQNGTVIKIVSVTGGFADLDVTGDNVADTGTALTNLGITDAERQQLAGLYAAGQTLWRVPTTHLSTLDCNWPRILPLDAIASLVMHLVQLLDQLKLTDPTIQCHSVIECQNQILGESAPVTGTPYGLHYASDRVVGRTAANVVSIPLSGPTIPASLKQIALEVLVAGRVTRETFPAAPNQTTTFVWDGIDAYGRSLQGQQPATIRVGYVYDALYAEPATVAQSFARFGGASFTANRAREEITIWSEKRVLVGGWDARANGLGGWTLSPHHAYDPVGQVLYLGNGQRRSASSLNTNVITRIAGTGAQAFGGDGGPAINASLSVPRGIAVGPDGSLYIADRNNRRIRRVGPDGVMSTIAIAGSQDSPNRVAFGPDGRVYFTDQGTSPFQRNRVRRVELNGSLTIIAGTEAPGYSGDGGPANLATLNTPGGLAFGPDGSLYIADAGNNAIRRIAPDGTIMTVAGNGQSCPSNLPCGDGGPASAAQFSRPSDIAVAPDGSLYIADTLLGRIRRIGPDGIITRFAGVRGSVSGNQGNGDLATNTRLNFPGSVAIGAEGAVYITETTGVFRLRRVGLDGRVITVAGTGQSGASGDGGPAPLAQIDADAIAVTPDGAVVFADQSHNIVRRIGPPLPGFTAADIAIASEEGGLLYRFNQFGRHLSTINSLTGAEVLTFQYGANGLVSVTEKTGGTDNVTSIQRNGSGKPTAIVGPFGQQTLLSVDANGYLASVTNPANETWSLIHSNTGLLTQFATPKNQSSLFTYDSLGRLLKDQDAAGGTETLARTELTDGHQTSRTTGLNRTTIYTVQTLSTGDRQRTNTFPDGTETVTLERVSGTQTTTLPDGTVANATLGPDPRFGLQAAVPATTNIAMPNGLTASMTYSRAASLTNPENPLSLTSLTDTFSSNGRTFTSGFDAAAKTFAGTSAAGRTSATLIDNLGRPLRSELSGILPVFSSYDAHGRLGTIRQGTGVDERLVTFSYNPQGFLASVTAPLNRSVSYEYDLASRVTRQALPDGREILFGYDANGNLISLSPSGRPAHLFQFNTVDQMLESVPPAVPGSGANSTLYEYDLDRALTKITRPDGSTLNFTYDSAGRLSQLTTPSGNTTYAYNAATGKLLSINAPGSEGLAYTFNGVLRTNVSWTGSVNGSVGYSYDNDFRVTSINVNSVNPISFAYTDGDGLLTQAGDLSITRSPQNGLLTGTTLGLVADNYTYNGFAEVTSYLAKHGSADLFKNDFTYDKLGRVTQKIETIGNLTTTYDYSYDLAGRLSEVKQNGVNTATYIYDSNSNRLSGPGLTTSPTYDNQDRLLTYANNSYTYTANGEVATKSSDGVITTYNYDVLGNLRSVTLPSSTTIDYVIDGQNRRIGKKINGTLVQGLLYQGQLAPVAELDGNGNIVSRFVYASRVNVPDYMIKDGVTYRIIKGHLSSPRLVVDVATSTIAQRMDYDEFGNVLVDTNPGFQPFGFAGGLYDPMTKLTRFGARDYDAETGRWTAKDPIGFGGGDANLYGYVLGDPVNGIDSHGLDPCRLGGIPILPIRPIPPSGKHPCEDPSNPQYNSPWCKEYRERKRRPSQLQQDLISRFAPVLFSDPKTQQIVLEVMQGADGQSLLAKGFTPAELEKAANDALDAKQTVQNVVAGGNAFFNGVLLVGVGLSTGGAGAAATQTGQNVVPFIVKEAVQEGLKKVVGF